MLPEPLILPPPDDDGDDRDAGWVFDSAAVLDVNTLTEGTR